MSQTGLLVLSAFLLLLVGGRVKAEEWYSDAKFPSEAKSAPASPKVPFYQIGNRLKRVNELLEEKKQALNELAILQVERQFDTFGYHSDFLPAVPGVPEEPLWTLDFGRGLFATEAFVMVPAFDQRSEEIKGYAFPKRFRICALDQEGQIAKVLVDWTAEDFADPGMRPVFFAFPEKVFFGWDLRLEVYAGHEERGLEYFSLGRVFPIRQGEQQKTTVEAVSSSFESPPYWSEHYLAGSWQLLGMPLCSEKVEGDDLTIQLPKSRLEKPLVIRIDLDEDDELGWVNLLPGKGPEEINVPGYGLPNQIRLFRIEHSPSSGQLRRIALEQQVIRGKPGSNLLRIRGGGWPLRALEIECNDFPVYQKQATFSLGEVQVFKGSRILSEGRRVTARGVELEEEVDLAVLVDGKASGREILPLVQWWQELAQGKTYERQIASLRAEHWELSQRWQTIRGGLLIGFIILTVVALAAFALLAARSRQLAETRLRRQIYSDLHDEVGSNLGSISLLVGQLEKVARSDRMKEGMFDLGLMTREAGVSLREVVWMADQKTILLPALIQKLSERAERVLNEAEFFSEVPKDLPNEVVSLPIKRHLLMFFKEVVHNCSRHAKASEVRFVVGVNEGQLRIELCDNGCGFDPAQQTEGWGFGSMEQRASEMGGQMQFTSSLGQGTTVALEIPLSVLSREPTHAYKTSN